jgi:hypothetical protein
MRPQEITRTAKGKMRKTQATNEAPDWQRIAIKNTETTPKIECAAM